MATSGTYTETRTAAQLLFDTYLDLGRVDITVGSVGTNQETVAIRKLNDIIYQYKGPPNKILSGMKMWQRERQSITLDSTKNSYSLRPAGGEANIQIPEEIESVLLRHTSSSTDAPPLEQMNLDEYEGLPAKSVAGAPKKWYYEKRLDEGELYLDCKPSSSVASNYTLEIVYRQPIEIITAAANEFDFPPEMYRFLRYQLGMDLAPSLNPSKFQVLQGLRNEAMALANTFEPENEDIYFERDRDDD